MGQLAPDLHVIPQDQAIFAVPVFSDLTVEVVDQGFNVVGAAFELPVLLVAKGLVVKDGHDELPADLFAPVGSVLQDLLSLVQQNSGFGDVAFVGQLDSLSVELLCFLGEDVCNRRRGYLYRRSKQVFLWRFKC